MVQRYQAKFEKNCSRVQNTWFEAQPGLTVYFTPSRNSTIGELANNVHIHCMYFVLYICISDICSVLITSTKAVKLCTLMSLCLVRKWQQSKDQKTVPTPGLHTDLTQNQTPQGGGERNYINSHKIIDFVPPKAKSKKQKAKSKKIQLGKMTKERKGKFLRLHIEGQQTWKYFWGR